MNLLVHFFNVATNVILIISSYSNEPGESIKGLSAAQSGIFAVKVYQSSIYEGPSVNIMANDVLGDHKTNEGHDQAKGECQASEMLKASLARKDSHEDDQHKGIEKVGMELLRTCVFNLLIANRGRTSARGSR